MSKPLVSVIMLVYNNVQFLKAAIDSVLEQSYSNWELLINDDGSTDGAWELIQTLAELDSRIKPQQNAPKLGIPKNRKSAYDRSSGELVCHLDGDDALFPWSLETMVNHMEKDPDVAIAYSDFAWVDASGKVFSYYKTSDVQPNLAQMGASWRHLGMYRKSFYEKTEGINTKMMVACEDVDLFMQLAEVGKLLRVPYVLYKYRRHDKQTTAADATLSSRNCSTCTERSYCNYIRVWSKHAEFDHITWTSLKTKEATIA